MPTFIQGLTLVILALMLVLSAYCVHIHRRLSSVITTNKDVRFAVRILTLMLALGILRAAMSTLIVFVPAFDTTAVNAVMIASMALLFVLALISGFRTWRIMRRTYAAVSEDDSTNEQK